MTSPFGTAIEAFQYALRKGLDLCMSLKEIEKKMTRTYRDKYTRKRLRVEVIPVVCLACSSGSSSARPTSPACFLMFCGRAGRLAFVIATAAAAWLACQKSKTRRWRFCSGGGGGVGGGGGFRGSGDGASDLPGPTPRTVVHSRRAENRLSAGVQLSVPRSSAWLRSSASSATQVGDVADDRRL